MFTILYVLALPAVFYPAICYTYRRRLRYKRLEITAIMHRGDAFATYIKTFGAASGLSVEQTVDKLFESYYAWRAYVLPIFMNMMVTSGAMILVLARFHWPMGLGDIESQIRELPLESATAIVGAFIWGIFEILQRYENIDLSPVSLHYIWLRMIAAPIIAPLFAVALASQMKALAGFVIGIFPLSTLFDFLKLQAKDKMKLSGPVEPVEPPTLNVLQGMTESVLERLRQERIESAQHLANADPVKLLLKTNLEWKAILDLIDQAILFGFLGSKGERLRPIGIRGAIELASLQELLEDKRTDVRDQAERVLGIVASKLEQDVPGVKNLILNAYEDLQVNLVWALWGDEDFNASDEDSGADEDAEVPTGRADLVGKTTGAS